MRYAGSLLVACFLAGCSTAPIETPVAEAAESTPKKETDTAPVITQDEPTEAELFEARLVELGLPTDVEYPYWPLVYSELNNKSFMNWYVAPSGREYMLDSRLISVKITNYGAKPVTRVRVGFDLGSKKDNSKLGNIWERTDRVEPGQTWLCSTNDKEYNGWDVISVNITGIGITGDPRYR